MNHIASKNSSFDTFQLETKKIKDKKLAKIKERLEYIENYFKQLPPPEEEGLYVLVVFQSKAERWLKISKEKSLIGRSKDADIQIMDPNVSRIHCTIEINNKTPLVIDNDSKNSIYVNGEKCKSRCLCDGDIIRLGNSELVILKNSKEDLEIFDF